MPKRGIVAEDLYRLRYVSDPQVAPNGAWVAFAVTTIDRDGELYRSTIHRMPTAGGTPEPTCRGHAPQVEPRRLQAGLPAREAGVDLGVRQRSPAVD